jgi:phosphatidylserine/phosphatidylglycerophosphate/cardiolipin synthase-like enzyme
MPVPNSSAAESIATFLAGTLPEAGDTIATALEAGRLRLNQSSVGIAALRGIDQRTATRCAEMFASVRGHLSEDAVAVALRVGDELRQIENLKRPHIEIVWTGPEAEGPLVRETRTVLTEMLEAAQGSGEVLVVGYSLTAAEGGAMRGVIELLSEAAKRQAVITMLLHRDEAGDNLRNLLAAWDVRASKPKVLTWRPPVTAGYRLLHAKALVVDRLEALVTSANLTYHGLEANIELGLRVRGPQAAAIAERFDHLIAAGEFEEWRPE